MILEQELSSHAPTPAAQHAVLAYARADLVRPLPQLDPFVAGFLHLVTAGVFSWIWFNKMHDGLTRTRRTDPSGAAGVLFCLIPIFNFYWFFFTILRLVERIDDQRALHGLTPSGCRPIAISFCVGMMVPWYNLFVALPIVGTFLALTLQARVNEIAGFQARMPGSGRPSGR